MKGGHGSNGNDELAMKKCLFFIFIPIIIGMMGCSSKKMVNLQVKYITTDSVPVKTNDRPAQAQIAEAATAIGQSLQELSAMQLALHPQTKLGNPLDANAVGMGKLASIDWTGPAQPLLKKIAQATNYQLNVIGKPPAIPVLVSLNMRNIPIATILRDVTYQVVTKANVVVYPRKRLIELRYRGI